MSEAYRGTATLDDLLQSGSPYRPGANSPLVITTDGGRLVAAGTVHLFLRRAQTADDDGAARHGRRELLATVTTGALLYCADDTVPAGWEFLAVGDSSAQIIDITDEMYARIAPLALTRGVLKVAEGIAEIGVHSDADSPAAAFAMLRHSIAGARSRIEAREYTDRVRRQQTADAEDRAMAHAIGDLTTVTTGDDPVAAGHLVVGSAALETALADLGRFLNISFPSPDRTDNAAFRSVPERLRGSQCRTRVITLDEGWSKRPGAALLGFIDEGTTPVALIPFRGGYRVRLPDDRVLQAVDAGLAARFSGTAYVLYRGFPDDATGATILRSSLHMIRDDLMRLFMFGVLAGLISILTPLAVSTVFASVIPTGSKQLLAAVTALLLGAAITLAVVTYTQNVVSVRMAGRLAAFLEPALTDRLIRLPSSFFRRHDTGDLAARAGGLEQIRQLLSGAVLSSMLGLMIAIISAGVLVIYSPLLALITFVVIALVAAIIVRLNVAVVAQQAVLLETSGDISAMLYQVLRGISKVRISGAEQRMMVRWAEMFRRQERASFVAGTVQAWISALTVALPAAIALIIYVAIVGGLAPGMSSPRFLGLVTAIGQFTVALTAMVTTTGPLLAVAPLWRRLSVILDEPAEAGGTERPGILSGRIRTHDLTFTYGNDNNDGGGQPVLEGVNLDIEPGQFVAFTGPSGSGKSTLLRLLIGLDTPTSGVITFDGRDLRALDGQEVRRQLGVVMQSATPLPGAILSSIVGDSGADEDRAWQAADDAAVADDIRRMPMKMQTIVGEGGLTLSGGQVQRIMIARALIRTPRIIVFDEATSALDDTTQALVSDRLDQMDATRIVVAHRLSTIRRADRIHVLVDGQIVQSGTYDELMSREGEFRQLARRQLV